MAISFFHLEVGKGLGFIITSGDTIKDLSGGTITLLTNGHSSFPMSIVSAGSGAIEYTLQINDFPKPQDLLGQLRVSLPGTPPETTYTSTFQVTAKPTLES